MSLHYRLSFKGHVDVQERGLRLIYICEVFLTCDALEGIRSRDNPVFTKCGENLASRAALGVGDLNVTFFPILEYTRNLNTFTPSN